MQKKSNDSNVKTLTRIPFTISEEDSSDNSALIQANKKTLDAILDKKNLAKTFSIDKKELEQKIVVLSGDIELKVKELGALTSEKKEVEHQLLILRENNNNYKTRIGEYKDNHEFLTKKNEELEGNIASVNNELEKQIHENEALKKLNKEYSLEIETLKTKIEENKANGGSDDDSIELTEKIEKITQEFEEKIAELVREKEEVEDKKADLEIVYQESIENIDSLKKEIETHKAGLDSKENGSDEDEEFFSALSQKVEEIKQHELKNSELEEKYSVCSENLLLLNTELEEKNASIESLKEELQREKTEIENKMADLDNRYQLSLQEVISLKDEIQSQKKYVSDTKESSEKLGEEYNSLLLEFQEVNKKLSKMNVDAKDDKIDEPIEKIVENKSELIAGKKVSVDTPQNNNKRMIYIVVGIFALILIGGTGFAYSQGLLSYSKAAPLTLQGESAFNNISEETVAQESKKEVEKKSSNFESVVFDNMEEAPAVTVSVPASKAFEENLQKSDEKTSNVKKKQYTVAELLEYSKNFKINGEQFSFLNHSYSKGSDFGGFKVLFIKENTKQIYFFNPYSSTTLLVTVD